MPSRHRPEGYLLIDDRCSGGRLRETATATCSHCHVQVVLNPLRQRERGYCRKCDAYICDTCVGKDCLPLSKVFDDLHDRAHKGIVV
jgi:hypothetical protein